MDIEQVFLGENGEDARLKLYRNDSRLALAITTQQGYTDIRVNGLRGYSDDIFATKEDLANVTAGLVPMGSVKDLDELQTKPKRPNDSYYVESEMDENGNPYIFRYDEGLDEWINTKQVVYKGAVSALGIISDEVYLLAIIDATKQILFGIRRVDGSVYHIKDDITDGVIRNIDELRSMISALEDKINITSNSEYLFAIADKEKRVLLGIRPDGSIYMKENAIEGLEELKTLFRTEDNNDFLEVKFDSQKRIIGYISKDGTYCPQKLKLPTETMENIIGEVGGKINVKAIDHSNEAKFSIPFPRQLCDVYIHASIESISKKGQTVKGTIEFFDHAGNYFKKYILIGWQGTSSIHFPKKNWSFDIFNDEACTEACEIKFGNWVYRDSFHIKANYVDAFQTRNVNFSRLTEDMYQTRPMYERYPFSVPMDIADSNVDNRVHSGAMCHIDGFPIRFYFNDEFYGVGSLNLSKHRSNYQMKKSNLNQVLMEMRGRSKMMYPIDWTTWELRNPSIKNINGGSLGEGDEPENGTTKDGILNFFDWTKDIGLSIQNGRYYVANVDTGVAVSDPLNDVHRITSTGIWVVNNVTTNINYIPNGFTAETFKAHINERMPSKFWVEHYILQDFIRNPDSISKNTLLSSYNNFQTVYPNNYDMDIVAGLGGSTGVDQSTVAAVAGFNSGGIHCQPLSALYYKLFWNEIVARYKELRQLKVLDADRVFKMHEDFANIIGIDAYKQDFKRWVELPNNRKNNANEDYWRFEYTSTGNVAAWNNTTDYPIGAKVKLPNIDGVVFTAKAANVNQNPIFFEYKDYPQVGGFYSGLTHLYEFLENQITFLDNYYN